MKQPRFLREPFASYGSTTDIEASRTGEVSEDRSAVIGHDGWCFIYEGSNNYRAAYHDGSLAGLGDAWAAVIEEKQRHCEAAGVQFVQLIVPNKASVMPGNFPEPLADGITPMLRRLLAAAPQANLVCPLDAMREPGIRDALFRRNDSHLTIAGCDFLAGALLDALGIDTGNAAKIDTHTVSHTGDLGVKFAAPVPEDFQAPRFDGGLFAQGNLIKTGEAFVNGFTGTHQSFSNSRPLVDKRILVIGNSFFERTPGWGMSPIFAALFREFHFLWHADLHMETIRQLQPDIVIAQTCERFLTRTPAVIA